MSESTRGRFKDLRRALLRLHKVLLDDERAAYEQAHGRVSVGAMLQLVINHEQFAWLHTLSEFIVRIDELLDADEPATADDAALLFAQGRTLLVPAEAGSAFERKYYAALQREPAAVLAHRDATLILSAGVQTL